MDSLSKIVARVEKRLKVLGISAAEASRSAGLSESAIYNMKRGAAGKIATKGVNAMTIFKLAPALKTTGEWLLSGHGVEATDQEHIDSSDVLGNPERSGRRVRIVGYVGAGSEAHFYAIADEDFEEVDAPEGIGDETVAVEIKGKSWGPLMDTWLVFYDDVRSPITDDLYNETCVVGLADDRILLKKIKREKDGSFTLLSNSNEPPIPHARIEWAAKVTGMRPRS